jgi:hypothetical protein
MGVTSIGGRVVDDRAEDPSIVTIDETFGLGSPDLKRG